MGCLATTVVPRGAGRFGVRGETKITTQTTECPGCAGTGREAVAKGSGLDRNWNEVCTRCGGTGRVTLDAPDAAPRQGPYESTGAAQRSKSSAGPKRDAVTIQGFFGLGGFIGGAIIGAQLFGSDNWIAIVVCGALSAWVAVVAYKLMIGLALVAVVIAAFINSGEKATVATPQAEVAPPTDATPRPESGPSMEIHLTNHCHFPAKLAIEYEPTPGQRRIVGNIDVPAGTVYLPLLDGNQQPLRTVTRSIQFHARIPGQNYQWSGLSQRWLDGEALYMRSPIDLTTDTLGGLVFAIQCDDLKTLSTNSPPSDSLPAPVSGPTVPPPTPVYAPSPEPAPAQNPTPSPAELEQFEAAMTVLENGDLQRAAREFGVIIGSLPEAARPSALQASALVARAATYFRIGEMEASIRDASHALLADRFTTGFSRNLALETRAHARFMRRDNIGAIEDYSTMLATADRATVDLYLGRFHMCGTFNPDASLPTMVDSSVKKGCSLFPLSLLNR